MKFLIIFTYLITISVLANASQTNDGSCNAIVLTALSAPSGESLPDSIIQAYTSLPQIKAAMNIFGIQDPKVMVQLDRAMDDAFIKMTGNEAVDMTQIRARFIENSKNQSIATKFLGVHILWYLNAIRCADAKPAELSQEQAEHIMDFKKITH